ncbi:MAG: sodium:proton antiporter [Gammaproteobacteria bacterium]|nr:sodium:proton antiporter [Gammaproteobacteria bacterium]
MATGTEHAILILSGLLLLAIIIQPLARKARIPFTATLVVAGYISSELLVKAGVDTGIRAENFHDLIFFVFLPVLVFESAYNIDASLLWKNLLPILFLAIPLMLLSTLITAILVYFGIGHPAGFPWIAALLTGALLSATDPVAVVALLRQMGVSERLAMLMEGESLFNDATAIVVFSVFLTIATGAEGPMSVADASWHFLRVFFGGILVGAGTGLVFATLVKLTGDTITKALATLISAYLAYIVAESVLQVSGVMAVLITGLILGYRSQHAAPATNTGFEQKLWEFNAYVANVLVFLIMGVTITLGMFEERWLAMLIGIAGVLLARAVGILTGVPLLNSLTPIEPISRPFQIVMLWGGLRGAVTLALALSLPTSLDYWWTIQSIAFGVVLFTLFIQATTTAPLLRHYGLNRH